LSSWTLEHNYPAFWWILPVIIPTTTKKHSLPWIPGMMPLLLLLTTSTLITATTAAAEDPPKPCAAPEHQHWQSSLDGETWAEVFDGYYKKE